MQQSPLLTPAEDSSTPRIWVVIPCAGTGSRAGSVLPKQYQCIAEQPMVLHTLAAFATAPRIERIVVVVARDDCFFADVSFAFLGKAGRIDVANCGGITRAESVFNGCNVVFSIGGVPNDWVLGHDAARCLITVDLINLLLDACWHDDVGGLLALALPDTLKTEVDGRVTSTLQRNGKWLAQTPQMFRLGQLTQALQHSRMTTTDESSAMESIGLQPKLVQGSAQNFKVTYPEDFALAEALLGSRNALTKTAATTMAILKTSAIPSLAQPFYDYP